MYPDLFSQPLRPLRTAALPLLCLLSVLVSPSARACDGTPPPPACGKTLVLSQGAPSLLLLPGGGTFDVPLTVYFQMFSFPAGSGICPGGPYTVDIDLVVACTPSGDGGGSLASAPLAFGYNDFDLSVTLPAGPPRLCTVDGTATATLADGMELVATNDSILCLGDPAPGDPSLPRLDMVLLSGEAISKVHPGDQSSVVYRITNNDPVETFSGTLGIEMLGSSRLPGVSGPMPPGTGPFAISDPGLGDNFPIGLPDDLFDGCLPLPPNPSSPILPLITEPILLAPGESVDVEAFARPWGMCSDGSCGRAKALVEGTYSDASAARACSGFVSAADLSVPPTYLWPDSGQVALFQPPPDPFLGLLTAFGEPLPKLGVEIDLQMQPPLLAIDGQPPLKLPPQLIGDLFNPERGRLLAQFQDPLGLFPANAPFELEFRIDFDPHPGDGEFQTELLGMDLIGGAPTGFENLAPFAMGQIGIRFPGNPRFDAFLETTLQVSGRAQDETGEPRDLVFEQIQVQPAGDGRGAEFFLRGVVAPGSGNQIQQLELFVDPRGFLSQQLPFDPTAIFADGFDAGNTSAWSLTQP